jgi:cell pole-organizing protein PopZ
MKIYSINERMPYVQNLQQVSSENNKKVRRFRLGHLLFTVQLHSWEVDDFDKKSIHQKEQLLKEKLPKKIRESLSTPNHAYDSKLTAELAASADKIHLQLEKLQKIKAEVEAAKAEADAKEKAEAAADAKAAAEAEALNKMLDEMLTARGIVSPADSQKTAPSDSAPADATGSTPPPSDSTPAADDKETEIASLAAEAKALSSELNALNKKGNTLSKEERRRQIDLQDKLVKISVKMAELIPVAGTPATVFK